MTDPREIEALCARAEKISAAIYLATDQVVADDVSACLRGASGTLRALAAQLAAERADSERLMGVIRGAANAGVQVDEPRLTWVELQMERDDWQALVAAAKGGA